jgi:hypothetical protein
MTTLESLGRFLGNLAPCSRYQIAVGTFAVGFNNMGLYMNESMDSDYLPPPSEAQVYACRWMTIWQLPHASPGVMPLRFPRSMRELLARGL